MNMQKNPIFITKEKILGAQPSLVYSFGTSFIQIVLNFTMSQITPPNVNDYALVMRWLRHYNVSAHALLMHNRAHQEAYIVS